MSETRGQCDARPTVTFPAARHQCPLASTKLYCLVTKHMCVNNLPRVALDSGEAGIRTRDLLITSPASQPLGHRATHTDKAREKTPKTINRKAQAKV